ncbi:hypothetical protein LTR37_016341 [Vermiconidia calcicola]|uniref:Uncharacterized protein n=1 Tax=Vermiconidia calcicola TaxID=1690605 RepID=A0ACC3MQZ2_9PEZI|nr:hypothetical protein LTR37_016341 [Vermiconidia calcicola]
MASGDYCGHCGAHAYKACVQCRGIKYCTVECQEADWYTHKYLCKNYAKLSQRPGPSWRRAILLPAENVDPHFIWIDTEANEDEDRSRSTNEAQKKYNFDRPRGVPVFDYIHKYAVPKWADLFGPDRAYPAQSTVVLGNTGSGQHLDHSINLHYRDTFLLDGSKDNRSFAQLARGRATSSLRGPVVICGWSKVVDPIACRDLDPSDLTVAIEGTIEHTMKVNGGIKYFTRPKIPKKLTGVKVNSQHPFYKQVDVPLQHPVFFNKTVPQVCSRIGLPVLTYRRPAATTSAEVETNDKPAVPAAYLHISLDTTDSNDQNKNVAFGLVPQEWLDNTSSVLVVSVNKTALSAQFVEAACSFAEKEVLPLVTNASSGTNRDELLCQITKEKWVQFVVDSG